MKIGIDAKWYLSGPPSGQVVVKNLLDNILEMDSENEYFLFVSKKNDDSELRKKISNKTKVHIIKLLGLPNFISNLFISPFYIRKHRIEVFLFQNFSALYNLNNCKRINYIHDFLFIDYPQYYTFIEQLIYKLMVYSSKKSDRIITISESEKNRICKYTGIDKEKVDVIYHGVSASFKTTLETDELKVKYDLPKKYLLFIGRINQRKNIQLLIQSLPLLDNSYHLVIIGKKDNKSFDIESYIKNLNIQKRVHLLGFVAEEDIPGLLSQAHLFVFPSFAEGFGLPPLEAMKCGVPVICSNATCLPEICQDAALYFHPEKENEMIKAIEKLSTDKELYEAMKTKGLAHATSFTWSKAAQNILSILKK